ncbi:MAG: NAD-dependent epimerase/dehydratase family protein [Candidatus Omnitrophota bacterium]|nr:NAD-dependent epimerase/dehydratase family protein [Candidatus Omnitrophota bacterium]
MKILVLGGDGFIGSHFVDRAVRLGHEVTVFDRFPDNTSRNLEHQRGKINFFCGDFANREELWAALENQDIVYHFISASTPVTSWENPYIEIEENIKFSVQFFELAAGRGVRKIVLPSSGGSIYGRQHGMITEVTAPKPFTPYAIGKLTTEYFLNYFREHSNIAADIYRIGNAYGPRQPMDLQQGVIGVWMGKILRNEEICVYGDSHILRDYVYVEDIAYLLTHSLTHPDSSDVYNIGTGRGVSVLDLLDIFREVIDIPFKYKIYSKRKFDNTSVILDSSKLAAFFPGLKFQKIEEKIRDTWLDTRSNYNKIYSTVKGGARK